MQVSFRKRVTNYGLLLQKMTYKDKASYGPSPPCNRILQGTYELSPLHTSFLQKSPVISGLTERVLRLGASYGCLPPFTGILQGTYELSPLHTNSTHCNSLQLAVCCSLPRHQCVKSLLLRSKRVSTYVRGAAVCQ